MPPGYLQIAGIYYMIESGSCGGALISTESECDAAATALDLSDKSADVYGFYSNYPPGCGFHSSSYQEGTLWVFDVSSTGSCSSGNKCICMFTPPSPPYVCENTCLDPVTGLNQSGYADNGWCQDGRPGAIGNACRLGTDCDDCGLRFTSPPPTAPPPSPPAPAPPPLLPPHALHAEVASLQAKLASMQADKVSMQADKVSMQADMASLQAKLVSMQADKVSMQAEITQCAEDKTNPSINDCPAGCVSVNAGQQRQLLFGSVGAECPEGCIPA